METMTVRGSWLVPTGDPPVIQHGPSTLPRTRAMSSSILVMESSRPNQSCSPGTSAILFGQVVELAPGYGRYLEKTDREMSIFRLSRRTQHE
jgi:hypothetical protein